MMSQERRPKVFICEPLAQHEYCHANADTQNLARGMASHADVTLVSCAPFSDPLSGMEFVKSSVANLNAKGEKHAPSRIRQVLDAIVTAIQASRQAIKDRPDLIIWPNGDAFSVLLASSLCGGVTSKLLLHNAVLSPGVWTGWKFRLYWFFEKFFLRRLAKKGWLYTPSEEVRQEYERNHDIVIPADHVIPIGFRIRQLADKRPFQSRILIFGAINNRKNYRCAIEAFLMQTTFKELVLAGVLQDESIAQLLDELDVAGRVRLIDRYIPEEELADLFESADFSLLPHGRGSSLASGTLSRALEFGVPIIGLNEGYISEWLTRYRIGITFQADNPHSLVSSLERAGADFFTFYQEFKNDYELLCRERSWESIAVKFLV
jgi:glycosyltransferase involved in cell wall biosynthesis